MANVPVYTDKTKEAVYEYSTNSTSKDLSLDSDVVVKLFYNRGNRQLRFSINDEEKVVSLMTPKKPDSTPFLKVKRRTK